jgi:ribose/xylose/arabinose/galactoside ABC-type transport system permease subunit
MTIRKLLVKRRATTPEKRDLIFFWLLIVMFVLFLSQTLPMNPVGNLQVVANNMAMMGIVAAGQTLVVIAGGVDLSVGSLMGLTGVIIALLTNSTLQLLGPFSPWVALILGLAIATAVGWIQGILISVYRLAPFIVTFGSMILLRGISLVLGSSINLHTKAFDWLRTNALGVVPVPAIFMILVYLCIAYLLGNSRFGRYAYAIGSNETVTRLSGVNVNRTRQFVYATSGFLAGLAGFLAMAQINAGVFNTGDTTGLESIAAVIMGGASLSGGTGGVWGTLGGVFLLALVQSGLVLFNVSSQWRDVITGSIIIGAALIDVQRRRTRESTPIPLPMPVPLVDTPVNNLDQAINRFTLTIQERYGCPAVRVYLLDRESGNLVEPLNHTIAEGSLVTQVSKTGKPFYVNDARRDDRHQVTPLEPNMRAVAAIPIIHRQRMIGVAELQSAEVDAFGESALETFIRFGEQMAGTLEDNWLLEGGWLNQQVRDGLRNLFDDVYLDRCGLADWLLPSNGRPDRSAALREMLLEAIEHLRPGNADPQSRMMRRHHILKQTYADQKNVDAIIHDLGLSRRQYFYDLREAIEAVTHWLLTQHRQ